MDPQSVGPYFAELVLDKAVDYLIKCVKNPSTRPQHANQLWTKLITGQPL